MAAVVGSVALAEAGVPVPAAAPKAAEPGTISFADNGPSDRAEAVLDEVLAGETAVTEPAPAEITEGEPKPAEEAKPATPAEPVKEPEPTNDIESAKLRKGFAKLADERQRLVELQNTARTEIARAQSYATKAQKHDEIVSAIEKDPAAFLLAHGGDALVQKTLQGFIEQEKSPAEREIAKLRAENKADREQREQREMETVAANWRNDIASKVRGDERFDLVNSMGLHAEVIDVITSYYLKHSERDDKGNVTKPAILPWETAAQAVEDHRAGMIEQSKRYGKRQPAAEPKKETPSAKSTPAPVKKAPTSLSSIPVADTPLTEADYSDDLDVRQAQILAEMGLDS